MNNGVVQFCCLVLPIPIGILLAGGVRVYVSSKHPEAWKRYRESPEAVAWWYAGQVFLVFAMLALMFPAGWLVAVLFALGVSLSLVTLFFVQPVQFSLTTLLGLTVGVALLGSVFRWLGTDGLLFIVLASLPVGSILSPRGKW